MCPVSGTSSHNPQDRLRRSLHGCSLAPYTSLLMPFTGSTGPVVHLQGLTGLRKAICESRLGYLYPCAWCAWIVLECSFIVKLLSWISIVAPIGTGFADPVTFMHQVAQNIDSQKHVHKLSFAVCLNALCIVRDVLSICLCIIVI